MIVMLLLMALVIVLGGAAVGGAIMMTSRRNLPPGAPAGLLPPPGGRTLETLQPGDAVVTMGDSWLVEGRITFTEHGSRRWAMRLSDADQIAWLYVSQGDLLEAWLLREIHLFHEGPPPESITHGDTPYRLQRPGLARVSHEGATARLAQIDRVDYHHYRGPGDHVLVIERWGADTVALRGRRLEPSGIELLPGDLARR